MPTNTRRWLLSRALAGLGAATLAACDRIGNLEATSKLMRGAEDLTRRTHCLLGRSALATEYPKSAISRNFPANGSKEPTDETYRRHVSENFANWRLEVGGLVDQPQQLSLAALQQLPSRSQITRHDCVEGWSAIAQWKGVPLAEILKLAGVQPEAKFIIFYCADSFDFDLISSGQYYTSIDLVDAYHPQTILAYEMNEQPLAVPHGAPIRLRVERQLGYKMAKYVMRIDAISRFDDIEGGAGGYWEDRGYDWYAGV